VGVGVGERDAKDGWDAREEEGWYSLQVQLQVGKECVPEESTRWYKMVKSENGWVDHQMDNSSQQ